MRKSLKILCIILGFTFVGIGAIGAALPVLPTTPFLLLASFFFSRGSDRFNNWFISTKLYKNYLQEFIQRRTMKLSTKISLLILSTTTLLLSVHAVNNIYFRIFILIILIYQYYYFIFKIGTMKNPLKEKACVARIDQSMEI